tara:strand:- start:346 stop:486 length:141 start_codon:yes stop_codon:yes gene_type:complete
MWQEIPAAFAITQFIVKNHGNETNLKIFKHHTSILHRLIVAANILK